MAVRPQTKKLTYQDFLLFPDDGLRRELIEGEIYVNPSPNTRHQRIAGRLYRYLADYVELHGEGEVFIAPYDVVLSDTNVVEPDLIFVSSAAAGVITEANIQGIPSLVIEVLSDPRLDLQIKHGLYARYRVPEYWVVDPNADRVEVYRLTDQGYAKPEILRPGETLTTEAIPGLTLDLADLLQR